ncbi:hypothetical protein K1X76_09615 [bacterium]|nr:hypothetical protein [bacterium]
MSQTPIQFDPNNAVPVNDTQTPDATQTQTSQPQKQAVPVKADVFDALRLQQKALQTAQTPDQMGHKMGQERLPQNQPKPQRPLAEPEHYRAVLAERVLDQKNLRDTPTRRHLEQRGYGEGKQASSLNQSQIVQLFKQRSGVENREAFQRVLRQEIKEHREQKSHAQKGEGKKLFESSISESSHLVKRLVHGDGESEFEAILKKLNQGETPVGDLPNGKEAAYAKKDGKNWLAFYSNLKNMGQTEEAATLNLAEFEKATFRGLMEALSGSGQALVSDLVYTDNGRLITEKFVRILIENPELAVLLQTMDPGDPLTKEIFLKLGEELQFLRLVHNPEVMTDIAREKAREAAMQTLRSPVSAEAQKNLERRLWEKRRGAGGLLDGALDLPDYYPPFKKEEGRKAGAFNKYVLFSYVVAGLLITLILYVIVRYF